MKYLKSKKIGRQKYELTLEVSDKDIEMFENLYLTYEPFQLYQDIKGRLDIDFELYETHFTEKYNKWLKKTFRAFGELWVKHD